MVLKHCLHQIGGKGKVSDPKGIPKEDVNEKVNECLWGRGRMVSGEHHLLNCVLALWVCWENYCQALKISLMNFHHFVWGFLSSPCKTQYIEISKYSLACESHVSWLLSWECILTGVCPFRGIKHSMPLELWLGLAAFAHQQEYHVQ